MKSSIRNKKFHNFIKSMFNVSIKSQSKIYDIDNKVFKWFKPLTFCFRKWNRLGWFLAVDIFLIKDRVISSLQKWSKDG